MARIWNFLNEKLTDDGRKCRCFLALCILFMIAAGLTVSLLAGLLTGRTDGLWIRYSLVIAGYMGVAGFIAGILYLYNKR